MRTRRPSTLSRERPGKESRLDTIIVIDVGTSSLRSSVASLGGAILFTASRGYSPVFLGGARVEQDAETWRTALFETLTEAAAFAGGKGHKVLALSLTSQRASIIPVDSEGNALRPAFMWQDKRSVAECGRIRERMSMEAIYEKTGLRIDPYFSAPKIKWIQNHEPDIYRRTAKFIGVQDWVAFALTGRFVTDASQACRTMLMDIRARSWDRGLLDSIDLDESRLPEIVQPGSAGGALTDSAAARVGLPSGTPVILAGGDQQNAALALNVLTPGTVKATAGTGSFMIAFAEKPHLDPKMRTLCSCAADPDAWVVEAGLLTSGVLYAWVNEQLFRGMSLKEIDAEVLRSPVGSNGVVVLPHFKGSAAPYWNPSSKGVFFGVGLDTSRGDIARAVLESIAVEMSENLEIMTGLIGRVAEVSVAGGLTRFDEFNRIQANCFNRPVYRYANSEASTLGALMNACVSLRVYPDYRSAFAAVCPADRVGFEPDPETVEKYAEIRLKKRTLYGILNAGGAY